MSDSAGHDNSAWSDRLEELFDAARALPESERARFLDDSCGDDLDLRRELASLLQFHEADTEFMSNPIASADVAAFLAAPDASADDPDEDVPLLPEHPATIGEFRIVELLGTGGMGLVYRAEQDNPRRIVALKMIRPGITTRGMLRRFELEAQVLGRLQHPGIAQIHHAGTADTGHGTQPYFAMELVEGPSIIEYADRHDLGTRQRLELMALVCDAVQHAHARAVVHRDLKPGNILVDPTGQPKILDFGVARAIDADIQTTTLRTDVGQLIGTLSYMSPEQCLGDPTELDTRSDVYALGVITYELLAGRLPYDLRDKMIHEAIRVIREFDPTPLSSINRVFRGDVETIIQRALEKDKERRYQSPFDLASDIRRYLASEPIVARAPSAIYQLSRFARRNKVLVGSVAAVFLALVAGVIGTSLGMVRAWNAEDDAIRRANEADAANEFLRSMLASAQPSVAMGQEMTVRDLLHTAVLDIDRKLGGQPATEAWVRETIGKSFSELSEFDAAEAQLTRVVELCTDLYGRDHRRTLAAQLWLYRVILDQRDRLDAVEGPLLAHAAHVRTTLGHDDSLAIRALTDVARLNHYRGEFDEARRQYRQATEEAERTQGRLAQLTLNALQGEFIVLSDSGQYVDAIEVGQDLVDRMDASIGPEHPVTIGARVGLMQAYTRDGRHEPATAIAMDTRERITRVYGADSPRGLTNLNTIANTLLDAGQVDEARHLRETLVATADRTLGPGKYTTHDLRRSLAMTLDALGETDAAVDLLEPAVEGLTTLLGSEHLETIQAEADLTKLYYSAQRFEDGAALAARVAPRIAAAMGEHHPNTLTVLNNMAASLQKLNRLEESAGIFRQIYDAEIEQFGDGHPSLLRSRNNLARAMQLQGQLEDATAIFEVNVAEADRHLPDGHYLRSAYRLPYGNCLLELGRPADAREILEIVLAGVEPVVGRDHQWSQSAIRGLTDACEQMDDHDAAARYRAMLSTDDPTS